MAVPGVDKLKAAVAGVTGAVKKGASATGPSMKAGWGVVNKGAAKLDLPSGMMSKALKFVESPPATAAMMLPMGVGILRSISGAVRKANEEDQLFQQLLWSEAKDRIEERKQLAQERKIKQLREENQRRLAMYAPHLYNKVMAGRDLPRDSVVIGGRPRMDLLQELADQMAQGSFSEEA